MKIKQIVKYKNKISYNSTSAKSLIVGVKRFASPLDNMCICRPLKMSSSYNITFIISIHRLNKKIYPLREAHEIHVRLFKFLDSHFGVSCFSIDPPVNHNYHV